MRLKKCFFLIILIFQILPLNSQESYNYTYNGETIPAPSAYILDRVVDNRNYDGLPLKAPEDLFVDLSGNIYIADTGNDRIVKLNKNFNEAAVFYSFSIDGNIDHFSGPEGVFVDKKGIIHVADTGNQRIVSLDRAGSGIGIIRKPVSDLIREDYQYLPSKLVMDKAGRLYVVGQGMYDGIMGFDQSGVFSGFLGSNKVKFDLIDLIWRKISSKEQQAAQIQFIPEEFSNIDIDDNGFIYSVTRNEDSKRPVKKHNAEGLDILKDEGYFVPQGDIKPNQIGTIKGNSSFVDVVIDNEGIYHCLDGKRGRVFTYSSEGEILSIFGNLGNSNYTFKNPVAIDVQDNSILVLDKDNNRLSVFNLTEYGKLIKNALTAHDNGEYEKASYLWKNVLNKNTNFELAYSGLGKIALREKDYEIALGNFKLAQNRKLYSRAFGYLRNISLRKNFSLVMILILVFTVLFFIRNKFPKKKRERYGYTGNSLSLPKRLKFAGYILKRPFDGMWDLKFTGIGTVISANIILIIYILLFLLKSQYTGFLFQPVKMTDYNIVKEILKLILPIFLFTVSNWSLTSLMDGAGSMKDIYISTVYSLTPVLLVIPILLGLSHFLILEEGSFYYMIEVFTWIWFFFLLFIGNKTIHEYSGLKTISMLLLTVVAAGIIIFLFTLFLTFSQQVWSFLYSIFKELSYRG